MRIQRQNEPPDESTELLSISTWPVVTEDEALNQGGWAYRFGHDLDKNPYAWRRAAFVWWQKGWKQARENDGG